jgi:hypothetical protein
MQGKLKTTVDGTTYYAYKASGGCPIKCIVCAAHDNLNLCLELPDCKPEGTDIVWRTENPTGDKE